ncbi:MAG: hypothetical protein EPO28_10485 [Saprospiraceae bacterium]|nr:MAG: hypothetical protein EPO28_10485 [Saprospiraceae bacterium]
MNKLCCGLQATRLRTERRTAGNKGFAIGGGSCFADSFVVKGSSPDSYRDRMNICGEKPAHRKAAKR